MAIVPTDKDLTFMEFMQRFSTPASCLKHLEATRWREGEFCPKCTFVGQMYRLRDGKYFKCPACKKLFMIITDLKRIYYGIHHHWSFKPMQRSINRVLFRININRISKAGRPMTAWDRINELLGQCLTARTTYKQLVRGEA